MKFNKNLRKCSIIHHISAPRRPNDNPDEGSIIETKRRFYRTMERKRVPKLIWDYLEVWICETVNL